jgi:hypothetical protein
MAKSNRELMKHWKTDRYFHPNFIKTRQKYFTSHEGLSMTAVQNILQLDNNAKGTNAVFP